VRATSPPISSTRPTATAREHVEHLRVYVTIRDATIDVPPDQREAAEDAAGTCPEQAISLIAD
jgi:ferredoxin